MITDREVATVLQSALGILGILTFWAWLYADYECDAFRQRVFLLRDEMFDFARSGAIQFEHPAYAKLRLLMNSLIRYAHRITFWQSVVLMIYVSNSLANREPDFEADWQRNLQAIDDPATRERLVAFHQSLSLLIVKHLLRGSAFLILVTFVVTLLSLQFQALRGIHGIYRNAVTTASRWIKTDTIEREALHYAG